MNRQKLIDSLPEWLRDRADHLLYNRAESLIDMVNWSDTHEMHTFWDKCDNGEFDKALAELKATHPEVYQKHYARFFPKEERIYVPDSIKVLIDGEGVVNGSKQLHYSHSFSDWFVIRKPSDSILMQRPYLENAEELEVGKVYLMRDKLCASIPVNSLSQYRLYLGGNKFVYWGNPHLFEVSAMPRDFYFYDVKDETCRHEELVKTAEEYYVCLKCGHEDIEQKDENN